MISQTILNQMIEDHKEWLETEGEAGRQFILQNEKLEELDFQEANLQDSIIVGCNIFKCCLKNVAFNLSRIDFTTFRECSMQGIRFETMSLNNIDFRENKMEGTSFFGAFVLNSVFYKNNLKSSNFSSEINIENKRELIITTFSGCILSNNTFDLSNFKDFHQILIKLTDNSFRNCILDGCNFEELCFENCDLTCCSINETHFEESDFRKTKLEGINLDQGFLSNCLGNNKDIVTVQAHLFTCVIAGTKVYISDLSKTKEEWFKESDDVVVQTLFEYFQDLGLTEEQLKQWWFIWKPILERIVNS